MYLTAGCIVGHVGDGNFHTMFVTDPSDEKECQEVKQLADDMARWGTRVRVQLTNMNSDAKSGHLYCKIMLYSISHIYSNVLVYV